MITEFSRRCNFHFILIQGTVLLIGRSDCMLAIRPRHEASCLEQRLQRALELRARAKRRQADGRSRPELRHTPGSRRQLQV